MSDTLDNFKVLLDQTMILSKSFKETLYQWMMKSMKEGYERGKKERTK